MKSFLFFLVILIAAGGWTANKFIQRAVKSSDEKERFIEYTKGYNDSVHVFLTAKTRLYHDEAFESSYRMWILSPMSDIDLTSEFDEQAYYRALGKAIAEDAKKEGQDDAYNALIAIAKLYGIEGKAAAQAPTTKKTEASRDSPLKKSKLGEKRAIPKRRDRYDDR